MNDIVYLKSLILVLIVAVIVISLKNAKKSSSNHDSIDDLFEAALNYRNSNIANQQYTGPKSIIFDEPPVITPPPVKKEKSRIVKKTLLKILLIKSVRNRERKITIMNQELDNRTKTVLSLIASLFVFLFAISFLNIPVQYGMLILLLILVVYIPLMVTAINKDSKEYIVELLSWYDSVKRLTLEEVIMNHDFTEDKAKSLVYLKYHIRKYNAEKNNQAE
jgi:asparagine N-glycosylation enzyme membrane subunit Stt3